MKKETLNFCIIDDDPVSAAIFRQYLIFEGYRKIKVFATAKECLESMREEAGTVLLDHYMGLKKGVEILKTERGRKQGIYAIYISSYADAELMYKSLQKNRRNFIVKGDYELNTMINNLQKIEHAVKLLKSSLYTNSNGFGLTYNRNAFQLN